MSVTRGLRRVWVVLSVVYILAASAASATYFYHLNRMEAELLESIEKETEKAKEQREKAQNEQRRSGYNDGRLTPEKRLTDLQEERRISTIVAPIAIFVPPIAVYLLVGSILWAVAGFKVEPPSAPGDVR